MAGYSWFGAAAADPGDRDPRETSNWIILLYQNSFCTKLSFSTKKKPFLT
jgi:hypothetical protein